MKIFRSIEEVDISQPTAVTVGTFDGVHLGHQQILKELDKCASEFGCFRVLVTFHPHPRLVVSQKNGKQVLLLTTLEEKLDILKKSGLDAVLVIPFTKEFSQTSYQDFVKKILVDRLKVKSMVVGHDHAFGRNREGHPAQLKAIAKQYGFSVKVLEPYYVAGEIVSSTRIRNAVLAGDMNTTSRLLGRLYSVRGIVGHGNRRGKDLGFPTANLEMNDQNKLIPKTGVYAIDVILRNQRYSGMMNIGHRPTFNFDPLTLEAHIFNFSGSIYGESIEVEFKKFIRDEIKFKSVEELRNQMIEDKKNCINI